MSIIKKIISRSNTVPASIAVAGIEKGAGSTHNALSIANYLCSKEGFDVIYIDLSRDEDLFDMVKSFCVQKDGIIGYSYKGVLFVPSCSINEATRIIESHKSICIVDCGVLNMDTLNVFLMCQQKIVFGFTKPWTMGSWDRCVLLNDKTNKKVARTGYYSDRINKKCHKYIKNSFGIDIKPRPVIEDPYCIRESEFETIRSFLNM